MKCPKCKSRTEVLETVTRAESTRRRRQCLAPACQFRFTTTEDLGTGDGGSVPELKMEELLSRLRNMRKRESFDPEAIAAAISVDARKAAIRRAQKAERKALRDVDWEPTFEPAPARLSYRDLKRELGEE